MEITIAIAGAIFGLIVGYLLPKKGRGSTDSEALAKLAAEEARVTELRNQISVLDAQIKNYEERERKVAEAESKYLQELAPLKQRLEDVTENFLNAENVRNTQYTSIEQWMTIAREQNDKIGKNTEVLAGALSNNQVRGQWGELTLRRLFEQSGLRAGVDYFEQLQGKNAEDNIIRPDFTVRMPDGKFVAVDSKVPYSNYEKSLRIPDIASPGDEKTRKDFLKEHARDVKKHIDEISKKEYFTGLEQSPEFTVMFLPTESLLSVTLEYDPTLMQYAFEKQIALVSPVSMFAVLRSIEYTWKQSAQEDAIKEIIELGVKLHNSVRVIAEHATNLGSKLNDSVKEYNRLVGSMETGLLKSTRDLNQEQKRMLDKGKPVPLINEIEDAPRTFTKPELTQKPEDEQD